MKKHIKEMIAGALAAVLLLSSFILPASAAKIDEGSSVGNVFGSDDRKSSSDSRVAAIEAYYSDGSYCTGTAFLVGKNVLLTAGHCLYKPEKGYVKKVKVYMSGKYPNKKAAYESTNVYVSGDYKKKIDESYRIHGKDGYYGYGATDYDWGIIKTNKNIVNNDDYFDLSKSIDKTDTLTLTGFPGDKNYQKNNETYYPQYTQSAKYEKIIKSVSDRYVGHEFDTKPGSSGSPIYKKVNGRDCVVGINVSEDADKNKKNKSPNGAKRIDSDVLNKLADYRDSFTVKYNSNGGTGKMNDSKIIIYMGDNLSKNTFTKPGCAFSHWTAKRNVNGQTQYLYKVGSKREWHTSAEAKGKGWSLATYNDGAFVSQTSCIPNSTVTLVANWKPGTYTITYSSNGGYGTMENSKITYGKSNQYLRKNTFKKLGYEFSHWTAEMWINGERNYLYDVGSNSEWHTANEAKGKNWSISKYWDGVPISKTTSINNVYVNFYAQWEPINFYVHYYPEGGNGHMSASIMTYDNYDQYLKKNTFTYTGKTFIGWYAKREKSNTWYYTSPDNDDEGWYKEGGQPKGWKKVLYKDQAPVACTATQKSDCHVNMYAQWKTNTFTVKYSAGSGKGSKMAETVVTYGYNTPLRKNTYVKDGYTFVGWSARKTVNGQKMFYCKKGSRNVWVTNLDRINENLEYALLSDGQKVSDLTDVDKGTVSLVAQWKKK